MPLGVPALCGGLSNVSPLPRFPLEASFFPLISFFFLLPPLPPPHFPFCQHFPLVNESKKAVWGGEGIIWPFLGSDRGWRCWQLCQSLADGFVMWALECPIWEGAGAKLTHSNIFPGMCFFCTYVQGQQKPVKEITPAHPSSILLPCFGSFCCSQLWPRTRTSPGRRREGEALPGARPRMTPRQECSG